MTLAKRIFVFVAVQSQEHSSAELTSLLGLAPDEAWDRGAPFVVGRTQRVHDSSRWAVEERAEGLEHWDEVVERLLGRLLPIEARFRALPPNVTVAFSGCVTEDNAVFGLGLEKHHVRFLAAIGAEIGLSIVVSGSQTETD